MLAGGKEVNYLMISGDVFESNKAWPKSYKFNADILKDTTWYYLEKNGNGELILTPQTDSHFLHTQIVISNKNVLVYRTMSYQNEEYALINCYIVGTQQGFGDTDLVRCAIWVKMSDLGGGTPIVENGGVNSPSYLLFIYDIREVTPYVG